MPENNGKENRRINRSEIEAAKKRRRKSPRAAAPPKKDGGLEIPSAALRRPVPPEKERRAEQEKARKRRKRKTALAWIFGTAFFLALFALLGYALMRVQHINVSGNKSVSAENIVELSGIREGVHVFTVDKKEAEKQINADPYLLYKRIEYHFPNTLTIVVEEREEAAYFSFLNACVITDEKGVVLGHTDNGDAPELPLVTGISVTEFVLGAVIRTDDTAKQSAMTSLLREMKAQELTDKISAIDLSDVNSLSLLLKNGMRVDLGQAARLDEKFEWLYNILLDLESKGYTGGEIDLSSPDSPAYRPEEGGE